MRLKYYRKEVLNLHKFTKTASALLSAAVCTLIARSEPVSASEEADFLYTVINGEATITGFKGEPVFLEIPEMIENVPVTQIRDNAFYNCTSLKQISLPSSISKIGCHTFYNCSSLESISLPEGLEELGMGSFTGCTDLTAVDIPDSIAALPESCFRYCSSLTEMVIPDGITSIGNFCFNGCTSLSYASLSDQLSVIGDGAFYGCISLDELYIPPSVNEIGFEAVGYMNGKSGTAVSNNFIILGSNDSAAEEYAAENDISFSRLTRSSVKASSGIPEYLIPLLFSMGGAAFLTACFFALRSRFPDKFKFRRRKKEKSFDFSIDKKDDI